MRAPNSEGFKSETLLKSLKKLKYKKLKKSGCPIGLDTNLGLDTKMPKMPKMPYLSVIQENQSVKLGSR